MDNSDYSNHIKGTQTGQIELLKRISTEDVFLGVFRNFQDNSFSEHPLENAWSDSFRKVLNLEGNHVTLVKWLDHRPFPSKFPTRCFRNSQEKSFLESVLIEV